MLSTTKQYVLAKIEETPGVDAQPDRSNLIKTANEFEPNPYQGETQQRTRMRDHWGAYAQVNTGAYSTLRIDVPLAGAKAGRGTPPSFAPLLRACALAEVITDGESVAYNPVSDPETLETVTLYFILDKQLHKITGAQGTATANWASNELSSISFQMTGFYNHPESISAAFTGTPVEMHDELPVGAQNTILSLFDYAAIAQSVSLVQGNTVNYRNRINKEQVRTSDRESNGEIRIDAPTLAEKDFFTAVESGDGVTLGAMLLTHGRTPGNIVELSAPQVQLSSLSNEDDEGIAQYGFNAQYLPDEGDDEFVLTFK